MSSELLLRDTFDVILPLNRVDYCQHVPVIDGNRLHETHFERNREGRYMMGARYQVLGICK